MLQVVDFLGVRCTDTRLRGPWRRLLDTLGVAADAEGQLYDPIIIPGGCGRAFDCSQLVRMIMALQRVHQTKVVILSAHNDCAATGCLEEFERNVAEISLVLDGTGCQVLAFFFGKSDEGWRTYYLGSRVQLANFISAYRYMSADLAEEAMGEIFFKE